MAGIAAVISFSCYGLLLNPDNIKKVLHLPDQLSYKARVLVGWISPLNQATFYMHNFGYDKLPTLGRTVSNRPCFTGSIVDINHMCYSSVCIFIQRNGGKIMRDVIRVMDVSKSFGEETVLHHISYDFKEGRIYDIVGNNGSGKTVLMKCICGFLIPDSGEIP